MRKYLSLLLLTLGLALLVSGLLHGQNSLVWQRAATICLECIGLG